MPLTLTERERALMQGEEGPAVALALGVVADAADMLGASALVGIESAHIDGCLYHGDSGALFAERLVADAGRVVVPTTLNVGSLDLLHRDRNRVRLGPGPLAMAKRLMDAYVGLGCRQTWTCAPYQAGHRPAVGTQVAWGESNAVVFCNSVLGARTNRYGDFLDICAAISGRAPYVGLHRTENRRATVLVDTSAIGQDAKAQSVLYPVIGAWLGRAVGASVAALDGLGGVSEDGLKALGAAAASTGAVGLFHVIGVTPEAPTVEEAFGGMAPQEVIRLTPGMLDAARRTLSTVSLRPGDPIDAVAIGSPHLSIDELRELNLRLHGRRCVLPFYACTGRHALLAARQEGLTGQLETSGVTLVADTCIVVTPILPEGGGVLMTNSGKFAHYTPANTGYEVLFSDLSDCVDTALKGRLVVASPLWN